MLQFQVAQAESIEAGTSFEADRQQREDEVLEEEEEEEEDEDGEEAVEEMGEGVYMHFALDQ